jgi:3D-(3,5/4)-trihydroxycyclohexane-1,2-dione acylhydrolase (decyclizing)
MIVAGGGVIYSQACDELAAFVDATGVPVGETQAGKGALPYAHGGALGAVGVTGTAAANTVARQADVVIGIGTRYSDFTTASRSLFAPGTRFVNVNVAVPDAVKHSGVAVVSDAREALTSLRAALEGWQVDQSYRDRAAALTAEWDAVVDAATAATGSEPTGGGGPQVPTQPQVIAAVNAAAGEQGVVVCAAGSMPGELHKLWRPRDPKQYHVEYGYSCMGYEVAGGLGVKLAAPDREVFVLVGDGSYLMMSAEIATAVAEGVKLVVVIVDNRGFASIGGLSETVGAPRFGTWYRHRDPGSGLLDGADLPTDLAANAASLGAAVLRASTLEEFAAALAAARNETGTAAVVVHTDPFAPAPDSGAWWDVPVAEISELDATRDARAAYEKARKEQGTYL